MDELLLLAEHFFVISRAQSYCKHLNLEISEPNYTALVLFLLVLFLKVSYATHSFETRKQNTGFSVLQPLGPSMYTLSMVPRPNRNGG